MFEGVSLCRELGKGLVSTAPLTLNAIFKIFNVGIVRNLGLIKKIKVDLLRVAGKKTKPLV